MQHLTKSPFALLVVLLIITFASACQSAGGSPSAGEAVVYVAAPLSGVRAEAGQSALGGARLAAAEINRDGGLLGQRLVVKAMDDRSDSGTALTIVHRIGEAVEQGERIAGVIGHMEGGTTSSALPRYDEMGLVLISPAAGMRALTHRGFSSFFRVNANDGVQAELSARFLVEEIDADRIAVVNVATAYGNGLAESLAGNLRALGATTAIVVEVAEGQQDFSETALRIGEAGADAVYFAGTGSGASFLYASLMAAELDLPVLASDGSFVASIIDSEAGTSEGLYISGLAPSPEKTAEAGWIEAYREVVHRDPGPFSINGYLAMQVLAAGVRAANSFEGQAIGQAVRESGAETRFGPIRFSANGDRVDARIWIYRVEKGRFRQLD